MPSAWHKSTIGTVYTQQIPDGVDLTIKICFYAVLHPMLADPSAKRQKEWVISDTSTHVKAYIILGDKKFDDIVKVLLYSTFIDDINGDPYTSHILSA